jgi:hypothetical protein
LKNSDSLSEGIQFFLNNVEQAMNTFDPSYRTYFSRLIVQYLTYIPEEANKIGSFGKDSTPFKVSQISQGAIELLSPYLKYPDFEIQALALTGLSSWVSNSSVPLDMLVPLLQMVLEKMDTFDLLDAISDVIGILFSDKRLVGMETVVPELFLPVFTGDLYQNGLKEAIECIHF